MLNIWTGMLRTIPKCLEREVVELAIRVWIKTIQTTAFLRFPGDLKWLVVTPTPEEDHRLMLGWKTHVENKNQKNTRAGTTRWRRWSSKNCVNSLILIILSNDTCKEFSWKMRQISLEMVLPLCRRQHFLSLTYRVAATWICVSHVHLIDKFTNILFMFLIGNYSAFIEGKKLLIIFCSLIYVFISKNV